MILLSLTFSSSQFAFLFRSSYSFVYLSRRLLEGNPLGGSSVNLLPLLHLLEYSMIADLADASFAILFGVCPNILQLADLIAVDNAVALHFLNMIELHLLSRTCHRTILDRTVLASYSIVSYRPHLPSILLTFKISINVFIYFSPKL